VTVPVPSRAPLSGRQQVVLEALCEVYLHTGDGVGSAVIAGRPAVPWSAATVRAELAALCEKGYAYSPHASAARRPTDLGLQIFAERAVPDFAGVAAYRDALVRAASGLTGGRRLRAVANLVSALLGVATAWVERETEGDPVRAVSITPATDRVALVVFDTASGDRFTAVFEAPAAWRGSAWPTALAGGLRWILVGRSLRSGWARAGELLRSARASDDPGVFEPADVRAAAAAATRLCADALSDGAANTFLEGIGRLAARLGEVGADVAAVVAFVEARAALAQTLARVAKSPAAKGHAVRVCVGPPAGPGPCAPLDHVSLLVRAVPADAGDTAGGLFAVLGPSRLDFSRALPLVEYAAQAIASGRDATAA